MLLTSGTSTDASEGAGAAAAILLVSVGVAQLLGHGAIFEANLNVGQISPIRAWSQGNVTHPTLNQSAHVLQTDRQMLFGTSTHTLCII